MGCKLWFCYRVVVEISSRTSGPIFSAPRGGGGYSRAVESAGAALS